MNLRTYLKLLAEERLLIDINSEVDARLEIACLTDWQSKRNGPALYFAQVKQSNLQICTNLFGSERRMALALNANSLTDFGARILSALDAQIGDTSAQRFRHLITTESPGLAVKSQFDDVEADLAILPQIRFWPEEIRSFLTLAVVISYDPESHEPNYGLYRVGVAGRKELTLNLLPGSGAGRHLAAWRLRKEAMPVSILLGVPPAVLFAAAAHLPVGCREDQFATWVSRGAVKMRRGEVLPCPVPVDTEITLTGEIGPQRQRNEGPFGCYRGNYGGGNLCPLIDLKTMQVRPEPLLPLTLAGPPPMEDCWLAQAQLEIDRARLQLDVPEVADLWQPINAAFSGVYFVRCTQSVAAKKLAQRIMETGCLRPFKGLVMVDERPFENWRELLHCTDRERFWSADGADFSDLHTPLTTTLSYPKQLLPQLMERLNSEKQRQAMPDLFEQGDM